jgi:hypothetical protein
MIFLAILCSLLVIYAASQARFIWKRRKLVHRNWTDLLSEIQPVNTRAIAEIAECYLQPSSTQLRLEPDTMWRMIGGSAGLRALGKNAQAMLDLAVYAAQWNRVEGRIVGEMMRRDGIRLERAIRRIEVAMISQAAEKFAAFELQEALASYHLMRGRLLGLYEASQIGLHEQLAARV